MKYSPTFAAKLKQEDLEAFLENSTRKTNFELIWDLAEGFYENLVNKFSEMNAKTQSDFKDLSEYELFNSFLILKHNEIQELIDNKVASPKTKVNNFDRKSEKMVAFILCCASAEAASYFKIPAKTLEKSISYYDITSSEYLSFGVDDNAWKKFAWLKQNIVNAFESLDEQLTPHRRILNFYKGLMDNIEKQNLEHIVFSQNGWECSQILDIRNSDLLSIVELLPIRDFLNAFMTPTCNFQNKLWRVKPDLLNDVSWSQKNAFLHSYLDDSKLDACINVFHSVDSLEQKVLAFAATLKEYYSLKVSSDEFESSILNMFDKSDIGKKFGYQFFLNNLETFLQSTGHKNISEYFSKNIDVEVFKALDEKLIAESITAPKNKIKAGPRF